MKSNRANQIATIFAVGCIATCGCSPSDGVGPGDAAVASASVGPAQDRPEHDAAKPGQAPSAHQYPALANLLQVGGQIYCGGEPHGDDAFTHLARLGVKTIVSVDGAQPDVETARKHGLQYVHIPIGYDGVDNTAGLSLARLVRDADRPLYIHCHHGKHRGPAAAAIACVAAGETDGPHALQILVRAGTSKDYAGLWRAVENYQVPDQATELPELVETAEVGSFAAAMAQIDRAYDNLKLCRDAKWSTPQDHPDLVPAQQALLLREGLRESARNLTAPFGDEVKRWLNEAESIALKLEESLDGNHTADEVSQSFQRLVESCKRCHDKHRN